MVSVKISIFCACSGVLGSEQKMVEVNLETLPQSEPAPSTIIEEHKEKSTIQKLWVLLTSLVFVRAM